MRYGYVGIGNLGSQLAMSLIHAGFDLTVYDRDPAAAARLGEVGATVAPSLAALWPQVAELCLTTSPHVLGASGGITRPSPDLFGGQQLGPNASSAVTLRHLILADGSLLASWQRQPDSSLMGT